MAELKTFVFTDLADSVRLKDEMPGQNTTERDQAFIETILSPHREHIERELAACDGRIVSTAGDGHFIVFSDTVLAARWAIAVQAIHRDTPLMTPRHHPIDVRISIHVGIPQIDPHDTNNFIGKPVDYAARLNDYAAGRQILVSRSVVAILEDADMTGVKFHRHGHRDLKGIGDIDVYELICGDDGPHRTRNDPPEQRARQWSVIPPTMGLSEFCSKAHPSATKPYFTSKPNQLGNYELGELLGSGGMGDVYKARHTQFGRTRAVKVIKQHFVDTGHEEIIRRFYREIQAVGRLEHPNIVVAIESSAPSDALHYLVMEYIVGVDVEGLLGEQGPLRIADACEVARQTAVGLTYIHQHGMVHRDIKPSNLMLTVHPSANSSLSQDPDNAKESQCLVKILDLGLALLANEDAERLTLFHDRAMGTGMYMAPEQWRTTSVDIRADIYSLGCTLYHMLAGQPPFASSDLRPRRAHETEKPARILRTDQPIPAGLRAVLRKMMAKRPEDRYASPLEVAEALKPYCLEHKLADSVKSSRQQRAGDPTRASAGSETRPGIGSPSLPLSHPVRERPLMQRWMTTAGVLAGIILLVSVALLAGRRQANRQDDQTTRMKRLQFAASVAAQRIAEDIEDRFEMLNRLAASPVLRTNMDALVKNPDDPDRWARIQEWLIARKLEADPKVASDSWFVNDLRGVQIARASPSAKSRGKSYAHRDYFHGLGGDLDSSNGTTTPKPITQPHQSAVYRSTSSGHLKVAFSVPITNGAQLESKREVLGVLSMSVDLGAFDVLNEFSSDESLYQSVLIDIGDYQIEGETGRGLVLHHPGRTKLGEGEDLPVVGAPLWKRLQKAYEGMDPQQRREGTLVAHYNDPIVSGGSVQSAAICLVDDRLPKELEHDTNWVVLVQEPDPP